MKTKYAFDLMISFAEEDRNIAAGIKDCLAFHGVRPYYYPDYPEENWARPLGKNLAELYEDGGSLGLVILSQHYVWKKYTQIEFQALNRRRVRSQKDFLLVIRADQIDMELVPELPTDLAYMEWAFNPGKFASLIVKKLQQQGWKKPKKKKKKAAPPKATTAPLAQDAKGKNILQTGHITSGRDIKIR